ncbi:MAG: hypothetical protein OJJ55_13100, partial [Rhodococcus sp.]|nr:hypothetical protein [Rhodococcus sp. (in: high G+C Gram-positive bacteria)]
MTTLRLAVISDIHAHAAVRKEGLAKASHVVVGQSGLTDLKDPFLSLETLISDESLTADYVICCGDLADKADPTGARYAWQRLEEIR